MIYRDYLKEYGARIIAFTLIIILLPLIVIISIGLLLSQGKSILFFQERTGKNSKNFTLYKFRTLKKAETEELSLTNREFTLFGKLLRLTGLDELPQLINILKGEMVFIGPRPMPVAYESFYQKEHFKRFRVKPGITGWAQVNGRNKTTWGMRFELDCWYVQNVSVYLDLKISFMTLGQLFKIRNGAVSMEVFNGTNLT